MNIMTQKTAPRPASARSYPREGLAPAAATAAAAAALLCSPRRAAAMRECGISLVSCERSGREACASPALGGDGGGEGLFDSVPERGRAKPQADNTDAHAAAQADTLLRVAPPKSGAASRTPLVGVVIEGAEGMIGLEYLI